MTLPAPVAVPPDRVTGRGDEHAIAAVAQGRGAAYIGADIIAQQRVAGRGGSHDLHAVALVARDQVEGRGRGATDHVPGALSIITPTPLPSGFVPLKSGADVVAQDHGGAAEPGGVVPVISTPCRPLPEMTLREAAVVPAESRSTPRSAHRHRRCPGPSCRCSRYRSRPRSLSHSSRPDDLDAVSRCPRSHSPWKHWCPPDWWR